MFFWGGSLYTHFLEHDCYARPKKCVNDTLLALCMNWQWLSLSAKRLILEIVKQIVTPLPRMKKKNKLLR